jgi:flagellar biosynthesis chaperone FliJ
MSSEYDRQQRLLVMMSGNYEDIGNENQREFSPTTYSQDLTSNQGVGNLNTTRDQYSHKSGKLR